MKKRTYIYFFIMIIIISIVWVFWYNYTNWNSNKNNVQTNNTTIISKEEIIDSKPKTEEEINQEIVRKKIENMKKKLALKWLILNWDTYFNNEEYTIALNKYLQTLKNLPWDVNIIEKIWDTYMKLKNFKQAYIYYSKIKDNEKFDKNKAITSLFYIKTDKFSTQNIQELNKIIDSYKLTPEEKFYYNNSLVCITDFSLCKKNFEEYFNKTETWSLENNWKLTFDKLINIKTAFDNYKNFKIDDLSYKWALISWAFFTNWLFPVAIETSKIILKEKSDYKPLIKVIAKSYFELWLYNESKMYLLSFNSIDSKDAEINYFLWVIYSKLREYVLSSIHLKLAIDLWYKNSIDARRRIIFNYNEVWEISKMLTAFNEMIEKEWENVTLNDVNLAIYYMILNWNLENAKKITTQAIKKYENNLDLFYWYLWWIQLEEENVEWSLELAEKNINKAIEINSQNPMSNYLMWKLEIKKQDEDKAFIYFKKTISLDKDWEIWKLAKKELELLDNN